MEGNKDYQLQLKLLMLGDSAVGKSSLLNRYAGASTYAAQSLPTAAGVLTTARTHFSQNSGRVFAHPHCHDGY